MIMKTHNKTHITLTPDDIKKAIETFYGVQVENVNTIVVPSKAKSKYTKAGYIVGRKPSKKKAIVTIAKGESIDLYSSGV